MVRGTEETKVGATGSTNPWPQGVKAQECGGRMPRSTQNCQISPHPDKSPICAAACAHRSSLPPQGSPKYPLLLREGGRQQQTHHPRSQGNLKLNTCPFPPLRNLSHPRGAATTPASCRAPAAGDAPVRPGQAETSTRCSPSPADSQWSRFTLAPSPAMSYLPSPDLDLAIDFCALARRS